MDFIINLVQLPFELLGNSLECMLGCAGFAVLFCCVASLVVGLMMSGGI